MGDRLRLEMDIYFSDYFAVSPKAIERYGAFNVSLVADLPLFVDPFLLFNSRKRAYRGLHDRIIEYLRFLKDRSLTQPMTPGLIESWYRFPEVRQIWLGFSAAGNRGSGLGKGFAFALHENLQKVFSDFGAESVTKGSHLEKLCLIKDHVGRDNISDFTTNLIREFLLDYTQTFAMNHLSPELRRTVKVSKVRFNYGTETWEANSYDLPWFKNDYVLLTPKDILTKDDTWINKTDLVHQFEDIADSIPNQQLREQLNNYFRKVLPKHPKKKDEERAAAETVLRFPTFVDYYIRYKEEHGDLAESLSSRKVAFSHQLYVQQFRELAQLLSEATAFYAVPGTTYEEAHSRAVFLKDVIENKGGHRLFYVSGQPIEREEDLQILFRLTWYATSSERQQGGQRWPRTGRFQNL